MKFGLVTIYVSDMEKSIGFYSGLLGLPVLERHAIENGELAFLGEAGQPAIEIIAQPSNAGTRYQGFSIGVEVPSLDDAVSMLADAGHPVIRGPFSPGPGTRFSFVRDPDGVEIELIEYT